MFRAGAIVPCQLLYRNISGTNVIPLAKADNNVESSNHLRNLLVKG